MPGTPSPLKLGFQRNSYIRVSCGNDHQTSTPEQEQSTQLITDADPVPEKEIEPPPLKNGVSYINSGEDDQMEVYGYCKSTAKNAFTWFWIVATAGILRLFFHWYPRFFLQATHYKCHLSVAEKVLLVEQYQKKHTCYYVKTVSTITADDMLNSDGEIWDGQPMNDVDGDGSRVKGHLSIHLSGGQFKEYDILRIFHCKKLKYVWDDERGEFLQLRGLDKEVTTANLHQNEGLTQDYQQLRRAVYGRNEILVPVRTVITLLFLEVLNPFYIFQLFSFILWFADDYIYYAAAILMMSGFGITMSILQTRKNQHKLRSTVHSSDVATVVRGTSDKTDVIPTEQLVPGDILLVPAHGCIMHCDAVLLMGNCIVNESMLTGESVPVTKTPLPCTPDLYDSKEHAKHTLFCGTHIIQTRYYGSDRVLAVVIRTGFSTAKGALVRSIMYPPPVDFKFEQDSYKFVMLLGAVASIGFIYTFITKYLRGIKVVSIIVKSLDLITIAVPPALPAAMTVGRYYAQRRLEEKEIYCISPRTINVSGSIDCVCFDKTGTLTEDGLDMWGVIPICEQKFQVPVKAVSAMQVDKLFVGLATCHSLTVIDNKISGDPLDLKMFEFTNWALEEADVNDSSKFDIMVPTVVRPRETNKSAGLNEELGTEVGILRQFPFSSSLQRMSVVTRNLGATQLEAFCKGSPEMILSLSLPETVPSDFSSVLEEYTQEGYRVIALAYKELRKVSYAKVQRLTREEVESNLTLLGLIVMENRLKPETTGIIGILNQANLRTIMVTGDNMLTALSVARDCGIVSTGEKVIIVQGFAAQGGTNAQLRFTHSIYHAPHSVMVNDAECGDLNNSSSVTSFEAFACSTPDSNPFEKSKIDTYSFAMTGYTWSLIRTHFADIIPRIAARGAIFARMSPEQKQQLVQELQAIGYYVAMCGDGANDCGALKAAHTGISLSESESSVASPFTSKQANISCVPLVIREGRAALVTSFGIFKYMAAYSLTQFVSVMILYSIDTNLGDKQFLYVDLGLITIFAYFFGRTHAFSGPLVKSPPILSLISLAPILSVVSQVILVIIMQVVAFYMIQQTEWFVPYTSGPNTDVIEESYENYAIFTVSSLQYIILALVFSKGAPYRKPLFTNYGFLISLVVMTAVTLYIILEPFEYLRHILVLKLPPTMSFRIVLVGIGFSNLVFACVIEDFIIDFIFVKNIHKKFKNIEKSHRKYLCIERELRNDPSWPPIAKETLTETIKADNDKPPRSPIEISEIRHEFQHNGISLHFRQENLPRTRVGSAIEVTLNPSTLYVPKRRHFSETESSAASFPNHLISNEISTLPRRNRQEMNHNIDNLESLSHVRPHRDSGKLDDTLATPLSLTKPNDSTPGDGYQ